MNFGPWIVSVCLALGAFPLRAVSVEQVNKVLEHLTPAQSEQLKEVGNELRCPTCTGLSVLQSDTPFSLEIKNVVAEQIVSGKTNKDILNFFRDRYGLWILRTPPAEGFHWTAWGIPVGACVLGAFAIWLLFWRRRREPERLGVSSTQELLEHMEVELAELRLGRSKE